MKGVFWRFLAALTLALGLFNPALASIHGGSGPGAVLPIPLIQNVSMGQFDRNGSGGVNLQSTAGAPTLVSVVKYNADGSYNSTCASNCDLSIDGWGQLVPGSPSATYGNAGPWAALSAAALPSYVATIQVGASVGVVNVAVQPMAAYVRSHYVYPAETIAGFTLSNPDTPTSFQLKKIVETTSSPLPFEATVNLRDGTGYTGLTPGLDPYFWILNYSNSSTEYQINYPVTGVLPSALFSDGSGSARVVDSGSSGSTLSWTTVSSYTGTGVGTHTYSVWGPGIDNDTTATCSASGSAAGSCTLSKPLRSDFVAGETVNLSGRIKIKCEHTATGVDAQGVSAVQGGLCQVGQMRFQSASGVDAFAPYWLNGINFAETAAPAGYVATFCGAIDNGSSSAGNILHVLPTTGSNCPANPRNKITVGMGLSSPQCGGTLPACSLWSGMAGDIYILGDATHNASLCVAQTGSPCTGSDSVNPSGAETYYVGTGNTSATSSATGTEITQHLATSSAPIEFDAEVWGAFGGSPGGGNNTLPLFLMGSGYGIKITGDYFFAPSSISDPQISQNGYYPLEITSGIVTQNVFNRGTTAMIIGQGSYGKRTATFNSCTGTAPNITCAQSFIWDNIAKSLQADFLDNASDTGDVDIRYNLETDEHPNIENVIPAPGDQFTLGDTTASTSKTYTFVPSITGTCIQGISGNCDGHVLIDPTNAANNQLNMICTVNAAHAGYVQISPFYPLSSSNTTPIGLSTFLCQDGVNLPAAETADPSMLLTYDSINFQPAYNLLMLPLTPGDTLSESWYSNQFNQPISPPSAVDCASSCSPNFTPTFSISVTSTSAMTVTGLTQGQVTIGAVLSNVSGATIGSNVKVTGYTSGGAPGGPGVYNLSAAITCPSACTVKETLTGLYSIQQSTLHPDFYQQDGLTTAGTGSSGTNGVPYTVEFNVAMRGAATPNYWGTQGYTLNGGNNLCCLKPTVIGNIHINTFVDLLVEQMGLNGTLAANLAVTDPASSYFSPATPSTYNKILGFTMDGSNAGGNATYNPSLFKTSLQTLCPATGSANNSYLYNLVNEASITCGTNNTVTPLIQEQINWNLSTTYGTQLAQQYVAIWPNYPTSLNTGSGGCGDTRAGAFYCFSPARGLTFVGSLTAACQLTTTQSLPINTKVNGPGFPDPSVAGATATDSHVVGGDGSSGNPYMFSFLGGSQCTPETNALYGTGAMQPGASVGAQGIYSGPLLPADNAGNIGYNWPIAVFDPTATHAPAQ